MRGRSQSRNSQRGKAQPTGFNSMMGKRSTKLPQITAGSQDTSSYNATAALSGLLVGVCSQQGKRPYQEDEYSIRPFLNQAAPAAATNGAQDSRIGAETHYFGLFDGHAGGRCSHHVANTLHSVLAEDPSFYTNLPQALKRSFHQTNEMFLKIAEKGNFHDGSTGIVAVVRDSKVLVANVGDCRCLIISGGRPIQMSIDQKPTSPEEQKRIVALGGSVVYCMGVARVNRVLAVSRAFGNRTLRTVIRPDAEMMQRELTADDDFLVTASDGLWDVLKNKDVAEMCYSPFTQGSPQAIADELVQSALMRGSMDNVTCTVVRLSEYVKKLIASKEAAAAGGGTQKGSPPNANAQAGGAMDMHTSASSPQLRMDKSLSSGQLLAGDIDPSKPNGMERSHSLKQVVGAGGSSTTSSRNSSSSRNNSSSNNGGSLNILQQQQQQYRYQMNNNLHQRPGTVHNGALAGSPSSNNNNAYTNYNNTVPPSRQYNNSNNISNLHNRSGGGLGVDDGVTGIAAAATDASASSYTSSSHRNDGNSLLYQQPQQAQAAGTAGRLGMGSAMVDDDLTVVPGGNGTYSNDKANTVGSLLNQTLPNSSTSSSSNLNTSSPWAQTTSPSQHQQQQQQGNLHNNATNFSFTGGSASSSSIPYAARRPNTSTGAVGAGTMRQNGIMPNLVSMFGSNSSNGASSAGAGMPNIFGAGAGGAAGGSTVGHAYGGNNMTNRGGYAQSATAAFSDDVGNGFGGRAETAASGTRPSNMAQQGYGNSSNAHGIANSAGSGIFPPTNYRRTNQRGK